MSDVLIKGMVMPKGCDECPFFDGSWCKAQPIDNWRTSYWRPPKGERQESCTIVELPPHGRLGDLDELFNQVKENPSFLNQFERNKALRIISDAPTVLEASE